MQSSHCTFVSRLLDSSVRGYGVVFRESCLGTLGASGMDGEWMQLPSPSHFLSLCDSAIIPYVYETCMSFSSVPDCR